MSNKVILINGPPQSGKDTLRSVLYKHLSPTCNCFSRDFKDGIFSVLQWEALFRLTQPNLESYDYEYLKNNYNLRQVLIDFSEKTIKPNFGQDVWAKVFCRVVENTHKVGSILRPKSVGICADLGFKEELETVENYFGPENVLVISIYRDGKTFDGDSRHRITFGNSKNLVFINNDLNIEKSYKEQIAEEVEKFVNGTDS